MNFRINIFFILLFFVAISAFGQQDSISENPELFALSAEDITQDRNLVESILNRKTTTAAQTEQFASDAPATVYVVSKDQIKNRGYESLLDLLDDIPEVEIQRFGSPEFNQHITLRGVAGNEKFIILQDGVRISAPTDDTHSIGYNFSLENAEQVEVIIGPASALYGADAFSGVIQIITKKGEQNKNSVKGGLGRFGARQFALSFFKEIKDFSVSVVGAYYASNEPDMTTFYPNEYNWYRENYLPNGQLLVSPFFQEPVQVSFEGENRKFEMPTESYYTNVHLGLGNFELNYNRHFDSYTTCGSTRSEYCVYTPESKFAYFIETLFGRYYYRSPNLKWKLESTLSFHTYQLDNQTAFINTYTGYEPGFKMEFGKSKKIKLQAHYNHSKKLNLIAGISYEILDDLPLTGDLPKPFSFDQPADLQNQYYLGSNVIDKDGNDLSIGQDFFYLHYLNYGTYLQVLGKPINSLTITAGLRYDINTRYGQSLNPRLGLVWKATDNLTLKMLYGEALLSPSPRKSNLHYGSFFPVTNQDGEITGLGSNFFHLSNPDLEPEKLRSLEGSLRFLASNNLIFTLNGYYTRIENLINKFAQNEDLKTFKGVEIGFIETSKNEGEAEIYGGTLRLDAVFNLQNGIGLNFYSSYSYSDGQANNSPLLFNARHNFKAGAELTHKRFSLSPRMIYRSTSFGSQVDEFGNHKGNKPYSIVNLFARYNIVVNPKWNLSVFLKINNLFDNRYYNVFIGGAEGFSQVPQRPLEWMAGVKTEF